MPTYEMLPSSKRQPGGGWSDATFRCGLSRPAAELVAIATLIERAYVFHAWVEDAVLYVRGSREELTEGLVRQHVEAARSVLAETLASAPASLDAFQPLPMPTVAVSWTDPLRRGYLAYSSKPFAVGYREFDHLMPERWSGKAALVSGSEGAPFLVHLLHRDSYEKDHNDDLGCALFTILSRRGIVRGKYPDTFSLDPRGLTHNQVTAFGTVAMHLAQDAILAYAKRLESLPVGGKPSTFTDDDNDARDIVLEALAAGGVIEVVGCDDEDDDARRYSLDGIEVPSHVFDRLAKADWLQGDGGYHDPSTSYRISPRVTPKPRDIAPRDHSVSFASFSERCRFRRYEGYNECANRDKGDQHTCNSHGCPLTTPVYRKEVDYYGDDPFFGWEDDRDVQVTSDHPGTERSYAWRAAGAQRIDAIVNTAIHAYAAYRAGYVCSEGEVKAAREAIALGHLVETDPFTSPSSMLAVALSDELKARVEQAQAKAA